MSVKARWGFLRRYLAEPTCVGAVAPSSRALARALCTHFERRAAPASVLEVGAGTGPVTSYLGSILGPEDRLDVCEIQPEFADILESSILTRENLAPAVAAGRVRLFRCSVQQIPTRSEYDYVISGLPFTAFDVSSIKDVFRVIRCCLKPGGVMSYFEYLALRRAGNVLTLGPRRHQRHRVSAYLSAQIRRYEFDRQTVLANVPPAYARHLRFDRPQ